MQFELRTQVIEPQRKTFQHLIDRYGDRPASRYEEGSIDIQAQTNFHYRPLWAPDKEIFDPDYSVLKLTDPYSFTDPRQFYYAPYVTSRSEMHEAFGSTLGYLEKRGMFDRLPESWSALFRDVVLPLRHYEAGAQMISANACRFGWGTTTTQCFGYAAFDRIGNAQILSRAGISFGGGTAESLALAKTTWLEDAAFQPLRKLVEETIVEREADGGHPGQAHILHGEPERINDGSVEPCQRTRGEGSIKEHREPAGCDECGDESGTKENDGREVIRLGRWFDRPSQR